MSNNFSYFNVTYEEVSERTDNLFVNKDTVCDTNCGTTSMFVYSPCLTLEPPNS